LGKGRLILVEVDKTRVVADVIQPGHQLRSGGRAQRLDVAVLEPHSAGGELVEIRRAIRRAAVGRYALIAEIVNQNQNDIGTGRAETFEVSAMEATSAIAASKIERASLIFVCKFLSKRVDTHNNEGNTRIRQCKCWAAICNHELAGPGAFILRAD